MDHGTAFVEGAVGDIVGGFEIVIAVQDGFDLRLGAGVVGKEAHPYVHGVGGGCEGKAVVGVAALGVVVVVAAGGRYATGVDAACGHIAVGLDADDGLGVDGEVVGAGATRTAAVAMVVVGRGGQRSPGTVAGSKGVPVGGLGGEFVTVPLLETGIGQLVNGLCIQTGGCKEGCSEQKGGTEVGFDFGGKGPRLGND